MLSDPKREAEIETRWHAARAAATLTTTTTKSGGDMKPASKRTEAAMPFEDDLTIPEFLRATGPGTPHKAPHYCFAKATSSNGRDFVSCREQCQSCRDKTADHASTAPTRPPGIAQGVWEEMNKPEHREAQEAREALRDYENQKRELIARGA